LSAAAQLTRARRRPTMAERLEAYVERRMDEDARAAALMQKMLRKKLYVLISTPRVAPDALKPLLAAHLDYMIGLERRGLLFASGPFTDPNGAPSGHGLTILRVKDAAEARAIAEAEPFFKQGLRSFELKEWTVMEGTLGLRINLSDRSVEVA
jgi:uncharacterized protein YciI